MDKEEIGISVIMPSYLQEYVGSRKEADKKFIRAVDSFLSNSINEKELIIVSDGCDITNKIYNDRYLDCNNIKLVKVEKRESTWPGELRECGRSLAKYSWICYLDSDDAFTESYLGLVKNHILNNPKIKAFTSKYIMLPLLDVDYINQNNLSYFDITNIKNIEEYKQLKDSGKGNRFPGLGIEWLVVEQTGDGGTWTIIHHRDINTRWSNSEKMGEDSKFILKVKEECSPQPALIFGYMICHITKSDVVQADGRSHVLWEL